VRITVAAGGVAAGAYSFKVAGVVVGRICAGTFETFRDGQGPIKTGRFWGSMLTSSETAKP
jgi:hypothetical protein